MLLNANKHTKRKQTQAIKKYMQLKGGPIFWFSLIHPLCTAAPVYNVL